MTLRDDGKCQHAGCESAATSTVRFPASLRDLGGHTFSYCDEHTQGILNNPGVFPGARILATLRTGS